MEGPRGVVPSCCPGVPGLLINSALSAGSARFLHNACVLPKDQGEVVKDQQEILLRNNSDHAVHIPSDQEGGGPDHDSNGKDSSEDDEDGTKPQACSGTCCQCQLHFPGLASIRRLGGRIVHGIVCDPLLTKRILVMVRTPHLKFHMHLIIHSFQLKHSSISLFTVSPAHHCNKILQLSGSLESGRQQ